VSPQLAQQRADRPGLEPAHEAARDDRVQMRPRVGRRRVRLELRCSASRESSVVAAGCGFL